jgi:hypothetical protein
VHAYPAPFTGKIVSGIFSALTVGAGAGVIRFELFRAVGVSTNSYFDLSATVQFQTVAPNIEYEFVEGSDFIMPMIYVLSGNVSLSPNRFAAGLILEES